MDFYLYKQLVIINFMKMESTFKIKKGLAEMLKGGVIMDVVNAEQAKIAESSHIFWDLDFGRILGRFWEGFGAPKSPKNQ